MALRPAHSWLLRRGGIQDLVFGLGLNNMNINYAPVYWVLTQSKIARNNATAWCIVTPVCILFATSLTVGYRANSFLSGR